MPILHLATRTRCVALLPVRLDDAAAVHLPDSLAPPTAPFSPGATWPDIRQRRLPATAGGRCALIAAERRGVGGGVVGAGSGARRMERGTAVGLLEAMGEHAGHSMGVRLAAARRRSPTPLLRDAAVAAKTTQQSE